MGDEGREHSSIAVTPQGADEGYGPWPAAGRSQPPVGGGSRLVIAVCSLACFMAFLDATIVNVAFPSIERSFTTTSPSWLSWVLNAYNVIFAALLIPAGQLADIVGLKRTFLVGLLTFTVSSLGCAAAPTAATLIALRVVQAIGAAVLVPTALGLLLAELPPARRIGGVAILGAASAVAAAAGPSFGGFLVNASSWRLVFVVNGPIGVVAIGAALLVVREQRDLTRHGSPDFAATAMVASAVALVALALTQGPSWGWLSFRVVLCFVVAAALQGALVLRSRGRQYLAGERALARSLVRIGNTATLVFACAFYAKILNDVLFLTSIWHYSILATGAAITPGPVVTAVTAIPAGKLAKRYGLAPVAAIGALVYAAGCGWYALRAGVHPNYVRDWLPGTALTGIGIALAFPTLTTASVESLPSELFGTGSAVNATARQLGGVLGVAIVIAIVGQASALSTHASFVHAWSAAAGAATLAAAIAFALRFAGRELVVSGG